MAPRRCQHGAGNPLRKAFDAGLQQLRFGEYQFDCAERRRFIGHQSARLGANDHVERGNQAAVRTAI